VQVSSVEFINLFNFSLGSFFDLFNGFHFCQLFWLVRATTGKVEGTDMPGWGLVRDGTSCGDNLVIVNYITLNDIRKTYT